jgi:hypothetical protein
VPGREINTHTFNIATVIRDASHSKFSKAVLILEWKEIKMKPNISLVIWSG